MLGLESVSDNKTYSSSDLCFHLDKKNNKAVSLAQCSKISIQKKKAHCLDFRGCRLGSTPVRLSRAIRTFSKRHVA